MEFANLDQQKTQMPKLAKVHIFKDEGYFVQIKRCNFANLDLHVFLLV